MAQVAPVVAAVLPAPGHALAQAQLLQQILHLGRIVAGHGQVMRAQRAGNAAHAAGAAVAANLVFELQQGKVLQAREPQRARRRQAGHAAAGDQHLGAARGGGLIGRAAGQAFAQRMAAVDGHAGVAAGQRLRAVVAARQGTSRGGGQQMAAAQPRWRRLSGP